MHAWLALKRQCQAPDELSGATALLASSSRSGFTVDGGFAAQDHARFFLRPVFSDDTARRAPPAPVC
jgi:hypothetical protein